MNARKRIIYQNDVFEEDIEVVKKYFNLIEVDSNDVVFKSHELRDKSYDFRGSNNLAKALRRNFDFANCLKWMPEFEDSGLILNEEYVFLSLKKAVRSIEKGEKFFIRPVSPFKDFCGGVFTYDEIFKEATYLKKNQNIDPTLIVVMAPYQKILEEFRCIFVNGEYVDMDSYMLDGEIREGDNQKKDSEVEKIAKKIAGSDFFLNIFDFVLDFAITETGAIKLLEVNSFQCSGFYRCDLDKIYSSWL